MHSDDAAVAADIATAAGRLLLEVRESGLAGRELKDAGDRRAHDFIVAALAERRPHDLVLSEEAKDDHARLAARRVWIVDPLDGTREFGEPPRHDWAVHVALVEDGEIAAGAVALPAVDLTLSSADAPRDWMKVERARPRLVVSRTRPTILNEVLARAIDGDQVALGSAGAKAMAVVLGEADVYAHGGGQYEWDSCAPVAVAAAAGLHTSRIDGSPLRYNQPDPYLPDLLICRPELADSILAVTGRHRRRE